MHGLGEAQLLAVLDEHRLVADEGVMPGGGVGLGEQVDVVHRQPAVPDRFGQHRHRGEVVGAAQVAARSGQRRGGVAGEARRGGAGTIRPPHTTPIPPRAHRGGGRVEAVPGALQPDRQLVQGIVGEGVDVEVGEGVDHVVELVDDCGPHATILSNWCTTRNHVCRRFLARFRPLSPPDASGRADRTAGSQPAGRTHSGPATATSQGSARRVGAVVAGTAGHAFRDPCSAQRFPNRRATGPSEAQRSPRPRPATSASAA